VLVGGVLVEWLMCLVMERGRGCAEKRSAVGVVKHREQQHCDDVLRHGARGRPCWELDQVGGGGQA
jgi:hypothetical protein